MERKYIYGIIICVFILLVILYVFYNRHSYVKHSPYGDARSHKRAKGILISHKQSSPSVITELFPSNTSNKHKKSVHFNLNKTEGIVFEQNDPPDKLQKNSYKYGKYVTGKIPYRKHKVIKT